MKQALLLIAVALLLPSGGSALEISLRPVARSETPPAVSAGLITSLRPVLRVRKAVARPVALPTAMVVLRPQPRPNRPLRTLFRPRQSPSSAGRICGERTIIGEEIGRVPGKLPGCGVENAVKVSAVASVTLSRPAIMDCRTAQAVSRWMEMGAKPALKRKGGGLTQVRVAAHYACRTRNSRPGARISEHGKGRAIDISGFTLADGTTVTVLKGWNDRRYRKAMRAMHKDACGTFGTVLGPNADRFHRDHFHFDTARYRSGPYCR